MGTAEHHGWRIAEVERLVGLSRRDIQRACYQGRSGAGVLAPSDGSWGRRTYDERDLATLFLLAQRRRREGLIFSQAAEDLRRKQRGHTLQELLALEAERLSDQLAYVADQLIRAEALRATLEDEPQRSKLLSHSDSCARELGRASSDLECPPPIDDAPGEGLLQELMVSPVIEKPEQQQPRRYRWGKQPSA